MRRLRAYFVTHYAKTAVTTVVAARNAKEALQKDDAGDYIDYGWAGEAFPVTRGKARRAPEYDDLAAHSALPEPAPDEEEQNG